MAFVQGSITRRKITMGGVNYLRLDWTDTEAGTDAANTEGTIPDLPELCRLIYWKATASASTIQTRWMDTALAAIGSHADLGQMQTRAIRINEEPNLLLPLGSSSLFYRDCVLTSTATVVHRAVILYGA
jgi:hypothetical protein